MTFAQWFMLDFTGNLAVVVIVAVIVGVHLGSIMERSIKR